MRRLIALLALVLIFALPLSGCALYNTAIGNDVSRFVDPSFEDLALIIPENHSDPNTGTPPDAAPLEGQTGEEHNDVTDAPTEGEQSTNGLLTDNSESSIGEAEDDGPIVIGGSEPPPTEDETAGIGTELGEVIIEDPYIDEEGYFTGYLFRFYVPSLWRNRMYVVATTEMVSSYNVVTYEFYYVQPDNGAKAELMTLLVVPLNYYTFYGTSTAARVAQSSDGSIVYMVKKLEGSLPSDFTDTEAYLEIYTYIAGLEDGGIEPTL